jgi:hypothetical protein
MSANSYSNLPQKSTSSNDPTIQAFDTYYSKPFELDANTLAAMTGFFGSRGFEESAAESIAVIIMKQAKQDGYNPMSILDTLKGLDNVEISALVGEILNFNRVKTSFLGYANQFTPPAEITRNIVA